MLQNHRKLSFKYGTRQQLLLEHYWN